MAGSQLFQQRAGNDDELVAQVRNRYSTAKVETCNRFLCVTLPIDDSLRSDDLLEKLSVHGDTYWYHVTSSIEAFEYYHWRSGQVRRALEFNGSSWEVILGDAEPWEQEAFFAEEALKKLPSWSKYQENHESERELTLGPDIVCAKDARIALLNFYKFWQ